MWRPTAAPLADRRTQTARAAENGGQEAGGDERRVRRVPPSPPVAVLVAAAAPLTSPLSAAAAASPRAAAPLCRRRRAARARARRCRACRCRTRARAHRAGVRTVCAPCRARAPRLDSCSRRVCPFSPVSVSVFPHRHVHFLHVMRPTPVPPDAQNGNLMRRNSPGTCQTWQRHARCDAHQPAVGMTIARHFALPHALARSAATARLAPSLTTTTRHVVLLPVWRTTAPHLAPSLTSGLRPLFGEPAMRSATCSGATGPLAEYRTQADADDAACHVLARGGTRLHSYHCGACGQWHLSPNRNQQQTMQCVCLGASGHPKVLFIQKPHAQRRAATLSRETGVRMSVYPCEYGFGWVRIRRSHPTHHSIVP
jgi:hypothetical protein